MEATIVQDTAKHYPVLLKEIISIITPQYGGTFIDCTLGQGGYTHEILKYGKTKVIGIDRDIDSSFIAKKISDKFPSRFIFKNLRFSNLKNLKLKNENIKGVIFDLGFSMNQIKDQKKGLSFNSTGELNMKMGMNDFSAKDVINRLKDKELEKIFRYFGEEKEAKHIVKSIVKHRQLEQIDTQRLVKIIENCKRKKNYKTHSATKVFQALRIFVNKEITELINGLINAAKVLKKDGVLVVVTFHSLEDKIVKYFFKSLSENKSISRYQPKMDQKKVAFKMPKRKPIIPLEKELKENPPSRSAKLRYLVKREDVYEVETDIFEKFKNLIEIENIGLKL